MPILIVDDEPGVRMLLNRILTGEGYPVAEAATGQEAIDWLAAGHKCSMVILDLLLPDMDGGKVVEWVEQNRHGLPIVVLSGVDTSELDEIRPKVYMVLSKSPDFNAPATLLPAVRLIKAGA